VIVTHNEELAAKADRKVVMKDGRIEGVWLSLQLLEHGRHMGFIFK
jgi:ABC-type lipoprotein export system ATPase subunit